MRAVSNTVLPSSQLGERGSVSGTDDKDRTEVLCVSVHSECLSFIVYMFPLLRVGVPLHTCLATIESVGSI